MYVCESLGSFWLSVAYCHAQRRSAARGENDAVLLEHRRESAGHTVGSGRPASSRPGMGRSAALELAWPRSPEAASHRDVSSSHSCLGERGGGGGPPPIPVPGSQESLLSLILNTVGGTQGVSRAAVCRACRSRGGAAGGAMLLIGRCA